jgi:K+-transporting ATPase A subunit
MIFNDLLQLAFFLIVLIALTLFNTAVSFMTNTNWQSYAGEATMSY